MLNGPHTCASRHHSFPLDLPKVMTNRVYGTVQTYQCEHCLALFVVQTWYGADGKEQSSTCIVEWAE